MASPEPLPPIEYPCEHCGGETGSDAMTFCSMRCQDNWRQLQEIQRIRDNLNRSKGGTT